MSVVVVFFYILQGDMS